MKRYRPVREVLADIEQILAQKYAAGTHPLSQVVELLVDGRHYGRVELVLDLTVVRERRYVVGPEPGEVHSEIKAPLQLATHSYGELVVKDARPNAFKGEDRVLVKDVAEQVTRFLAGKGKHIVLQGRLQTSAGQSPAMVAAAGEDRKR
jgi:hypothetical protein